MKYFWALILNLLYVLCYVKPLPGILVVISTIILLYLIYSDAIKHNSILGVMLELLCFTFPFAWRSIIGTSFADFGLCWFYVIGLLYVLISFIKGGFIIAFKSNYTELILYCCLFLFIGGLIPLLNSYNFINGLKEYMGYIFFYALIIMSLPYSGSINQKERNMILRSFTWASLYSSVGITVQFILLKFFSINFLDIVLTGSYGGIRHIFSYMFLDVSSQTLMLVTGAIICLVYNKKIFKHPYITMGFILLGTLLTSARTGIVAFAIIVGFYLIRPKSKNKIIKLFIYAGCGIIGYFIIIINRPGYSFINLISDGSGRLNLITSALLTFLKYPLLGIGYDLIPFINITGMIGHFYLLNVLMATGLIYTVIFVILITFILKISLKIDKFIWIMLPGLLGSCFIPDLLGARFLIIIVCVIILSNEAIPINRFYINEPIGNFINKVKRKT